MHEKHPVRDHHRVGVGDVHVARWHLRRRVRVRWAAEAPAVAHPPPPIGPVRLVACLLGPQVILKALGHQEQPLFPRARDRVGTLPTLTLELTMPLAPPPPPGPPVQPRRTTRAPG